MGGLLSGIANPPPPSASVLYAAQGGSATTSDLYIVDSTTGGTTSVGAIGFAVTGLAQRPSDGVLFGATSNLSGASPANLITIDTGTGAGTVVGPFNTTAGGTLADIAFRSDDVLFGFSPSPPRRLYTVNTLTGAGTEVSTTAIPVPPLANGLGLGFDSTDNLWLFARNSNGVFYLVDQSTAALTAQAALTGAPANAPINAAKFDNSDVCWAIINNTTTYYLVTIDIGTSVVTNVGTTLTLLDALEWVAP